MFQVSIIKILSESKSLKDNNIPIYYTSHEDLIKPAKLICEFD